MSSTATLGYFPAGYFPAGYFPAGYFPTGTARTRPRDDRILLALRDAIEATGAFGAGAGANINIGTDIAENEFRSDLKAYCFIYVQSEAPEPYEANGDGTYTLAVNGSFQVQVFVRENDDYRRSARLGRLTAIVRNALRDSDLGGLVDPDWTRTGAMGEPRRFSMHMGQPNAYRVVPGTYRYYIDSGEGWDEADDEFQ